jgi:hypothetical protein
MSVYAKAKGRGASAVVALVVGCSLSAVALSAGNRHRQPVRDVLACQFDHDCIDYVRGTSAPAICLNNIPGADPYCAAAIGMPPNANVSTALALGRRSAAADFAWMQVIQFIGAPHSESVKYAGLEDWIFLINTLDPRFRQPYFHGAILLSVAPDRASHAERILLAGREAFPDDPRTWEWNLWLGFVQYFGLLDPGKAADSYQRSFDSGGPSYLEGFARDLRTAKEGCGELWGRLNLAREAASGSQEGSLLSSRLSYDAVVNCWEVYLSAALVKFKVSQEREARSLDELRDYGLIPESPPEIAGMCWKIEGLKVHLRSCAGTAARQEQQE